MNVHNFSHTLFSIVGYFVVYEYFSTFSRYVHDKRSSAQPYKMNCGLQYRN